LILHFNRGKIVQIFENQYGFSALLLLDIYRHLFICKICRIFAVENSNMDTNTIDEPDWARNMDSEV
jgi:hypothetical protein